MDIHLVEISQTASSGEWSFNTLNIRPAGICKEIYIKAATATTTFDFKMVDEKSNIVYDTLEMNADEPKTATGKLYDFTQIPMRGVYTLTVYNSSADEAFTGRLLILQ